MMTIFCVAALATLATLAYLFGFDAGQMDIRHNVRVVRVALPLKSFGPYIGNCTVLDGRWLCVIDNRDKTFGFEPY